MVQRVAILVVSLLIASSLARPQQPTAADPTSGVAPTSQSEGQDPNASAIQQQGPNPAASQGLLVRALGSADDLGAEDLLHWGWVSLRSASFMEIFGDQAQTSPTGVAQPSQFVSTSEMSALIVLDKRFQRARVTAQYQPGVFVTNGNFYSNAANQSSAFSTGFEFGQRWTVSLTDTFNYYASQRVFAGISLETNYVTGNMLQNNYTGGPGSTLTNSVGLAATYQWTPRTTLGFGPSVGYNYATGVAGTKQENLTAWYGGGTATLSHQLTPQVTVGASYAANEASFSNTSTTAGPQQSSLLQQDFRLTYHQQFAPTVWVNAAVGVMTIPSATISTHSDPGLGVDFSATKTFRHNSLSIAYDRALQFNGLVTSQASDRVDLVHSIAWTQRFWTSSSCAYFRYISATPIQPAGFYATEQFRFRLARQLSTTGGYSYSKQTGDGVYLLSGKQSFFSLGLSWSPAVKP